MKDVTLAEAALIVSRELQWDEKTSISALLHSMKSGRLAYSDCTYTDDQELIEFPGEILNLLDGWNSRIAIADLGEFISARKSIHAPARSKGRWPWGEYETENLRTLAEAAERFWKNYDPTDQTTAPTNDAIAEWLLSAEGGDLSRRMAKSIATVLRADGLRPGPRRE